jgi:hypothetical protein
MRPDGSNKHLLRADHTAVDQSLTWSHDGRRLAFLRSQNSSASPRCRGMRCLIELLSVIVCATTVAAVANAGAVAHGRHIEVSVPAFPTAVAAGGGSVWLLAGSRLVRVDPARNRVVSQIDVGVRLGSEQPCDLAVAGSVVWAVGSVNARRSRIVRVDARSDRVLGSTSVSAAACVAATLHGAWVTLPDARMIVRLNRDGRVLQRLPTAAYCDRIVAGHGAVWAACPAETAGAPVGKHTGTVLRISPRGALTVVARDVLSGALAAGPAGVFASGVAHNSGMTVRVDARGPSFPSSGNLAVGQSTVWIADWRGPGSSGFAREVDAHTGRTIRLTPAGISPLGIAVAAGSVWLTNYTQPGSLMRIIP